MEESRSIPAPNPWGARGRAEGARLWKAAGRADAMGPPRCLLIESELTNTIREVVSHCQELAARHRLVSGIPLSRACCPTSLGVSRKLDYSERCGRRLPPWNRNSRGSSSAATTPPVDADSEPRSRTQRQSARTPERLPGTPTEPKTPRTVDEARVQRVLVKTLEPPLDGTTHWSVRRVAEAHIGDEHVFLALLHQQHGTARRALADLGVLLESARAALDELLRDGAIPHREPTTASLSPPSASTSNRSERRPLRRSDTTQSPKPRAVSRANTTSRVPSAGGHCSPSERWRSRSKKPSGDPSATLSTSISCSDCSPTPRHPWGPDSVDAERTVSASSASTAPPPTPSSFCSSASEPRSKKSAA